VRVRADKALANANAFIAFGNSSTDTFLRIIHPYVGRTEITVGHQQLTHIEPGMINAAFGEISRNNAG